MQLKSTSIQFHSILMHFKIADHQAQVCNLHKMDKILNMVTKVKKNVLQIIITCTWYMNLQMFCKKPKTKN